jgi:hypothetical protein
MSIQKIVRALVHQVWSKFPSPNRENHEFTQLLQYHPFVFKRAPAPEIGQRSNF